MKRFIVVTLLLFFTATSIAQKKYVINGVLSEPDAPVKLFLNFQNGSPPDSTLLKNGRFSFKGNLDKSSKVSIYTQEINTIEKYPKREYLDFYLEAGETVITAYKSIKNSKVKGGELQKEFRELLDSLQFIYNLYDNLSELLKSMEVDDSTKVRLRGVYKPLYKKSFNIQNTFIKNHPSSLVSWDIVSNRGVIINTDELEPVFNSLSKELRETPAAIDLKARMEIAKLLKIGNSAIEFSSKDPFGKPVSLSSFKGKYVLIDFWASWCGPCRAENPHMLKAYNSLKNSNFEIFGVSLDDKRDKWMKAIEEDKLPWVQVSDLEGFNTVAKTYGIRAIPQNILLNPEGKIIAKNLRGESLENELRKIMGL